MADPIARPDPARETRPGGAGGNAMTAKMMGLPTWAWLALAAAGAIAVVVWRQSRNKAADTSTTDTPDNVDAQGLGQEQYESILALLRDIQGNMSTEPGDTTTDPGPPTGGPAVSPYPGGGKAVSPVSGSKRGYGWYKVVKGDSAASIAKKYNIPVSEYYLYNGPKRIVAGQYVKVRNGSNPVVGPYNGK